MRLQLLYNPRLLLERLAAESIRRRRLSRLRNTPARTLCNGHIGSLELLELAARLGIQVIYDIGANVGTWSLLSKSVIPEAHVHAFEPLPEHLEGFARNIAGMQRISLHGVALGSKDAYATLHVPDFTDASSMLPLTEQTRLHFGIHSVVQFPTQIRRLDGYRQERELPWPDLLKLDVQGFELEVLKGASECLESAKAVLSEVSFIEYYEGQCLFHDLTKYLADAGLFLHAFGVGTPIGTTLGQADVLFTRSSP